MNLGNFLNISEALAALPNGGNEGDTIVVSGLILAWNATSQEWVDPQTISYGYNVRKIGGDLQVANRVTVGGVTTLNANVKIKRNLWVEGTLDAFNIKGAGKGLFPDSDELKRCYPAPESGWWAIVGDTIPGPIWIVVDGEWQPSGNNGGDTVDLTDYLSKGELEQGIGSSKINAMSQDAVTRIFVTKDSKQTLGLITVSNEVEINTVLDTYNHPRQVGLYNLCDKSGNPWAILEITTDSMMHVVNQCIKGNMIVKDGVITGHQDNLITEIQRTYNFSAPNLDIPVRTWGTWQYCHTRYLKSEFGDGKEYGISQKYFTDNVQNVSAGKINIDEGMPVLDEYNSPAKCGWYVLTFNGMPAYHMLVTSDSMRHVVTQFLYGNSVVDENGEINSHEDYSTTILMRTYNIDAPMLTEVPRGTWSKWKNFQVSFLKSEFGASVTDTVTQKFFTEQTQNRTLGIVDLANIDTLNNLKSLGHYHVYSGKKPTHELIVTSDSMHHTIIQYMFSNYTAENGELNTHQDNIATIVYRIYNLNAPGMTEVPRGTWGAWRQYGQNFEVLSETEYENLKKKDSEVFYYTYEEEEEA